MTALTATPKMFQTDAHYALDLIPQAQPTRINGDHIANGIARVLIVGANSIGQQLAQNLEATGTFQVVGFVDENSQFPAGDLCGAWPYLGTRNATANLINEYHIDQVFIAHAPTWQQQLVEQMSAQCPEVGLNIVPTSYEASLNTSRVTSYGDLAVVALHARPSRAAQALRRAFDLTLASLVLTLGAPLWLLIGLLVKLTSAGPALFAQERVGQGGKTFKVLKFRTMRQDAEAKSGAVLSAGKHDPRLTGLGKWLRLFRIDEVPQFINILRNEMSLVGPRPERPVFVEKFTASQASYARRHEVKPGITGLAQVYAGYHTDGCDKLRFDLIYGAHQSVLFDLKVLFQTIKVIVMPDDKH